MATHLYGPVRMPTCNVRPGNGRHSGRNDFKERKISVGLIKSSLHRSRAPHCIFTALVIRHVRQRQRRRRGPCSSVQRQRKAAECAAHHRHAGRQADVHQVEYNGWSSKTVAAEIPTTRMMSRSGSHSTTATGPTTALKRRAPATSLQRTTSTPIRSAG